MEGKIDMAAKRQVTNKLRAQYRKASRPDKSKILDRVVAWPGSRTTISGRSVGASQNSQLANTDRNGIEIAPRTCDCAATGSPGGYR